VNQESHPLLAVGVSIIAPGRSLWGVNGKYISGWMMPTNETTPVIKAVKPERMNSRVWRFWGIMIDDIYQNKMLLISSSLRYTFSVLPIFPL
jgi:hypothetical protein